MSSDGEYWDNFGWSVSVSGDVAVIGACTSDGPDVGNEGSMGTDYSGSAYVFTRQNNGNWVQRQKLEASDATARDYFGYSVSVSGDMLVVGAIGDDDNGTNSGSAYVFARQANGSWRQHQKIVASDGTQEAHFGRSVAVSGFTAVIGADGGLSGGAVTGSAYVFARQVDASWAEQQNLHASDGAADDFFGNSVSISGETAFVGAFGAVDSGPESGSAYIFELGAQPQKPPNPVQFLELAISDTGRLIHNIVTDILDIVLLVDNAGVDSLKEVVISYDSGEVAFPFPACTTDLAPGIQHIRLGSANVEPRGFRRAIGVPGIFVDGWRYSTGFQNTITVNYVSGTEGAYRLSRDSYGMPNPDRWSWHSFQDEYRNWFGIEAGPVAGLFALFSNISQWEGRSIGMAQTSNLYFREPTSKPAAVVDSATHTMRHDAEGVAANIALSQLGQDWDQLIRGENLYTDVVSPLANARTLINTNEPFTLLMEAPGSNAGHAVSVYKVVENHTTNEAFLFAYDSNVPDVPHAARIDLKSNGFSYSAGKQYDRAGLMRIKNALDTAGDLSRFRRAFAASLRRTGRVFVGHTGPERILVTDIATGHRIGFVDGVSAVGEIEGAEIVDIPDSSGLAGHAYYLPNSLAYDIALFGGGSGGLTLEMVAPRSEVEAVSLVYDIGDFPSNAVAAFHAVDLSSLLIPALRVDIDGDGVTDSLVLAAVAQTIVDPYGIPLTLGDSDARSSDAVNSPRTEVTDSCPNPFNSAVSIRFTLAEPGTVRLTIHALNGQTIRTLTDDYWSSGAHTVVWNGENGKSQPASSGVYLCRLTTTLGDFSRRITLAR